jgi:hypothetical protein
VRALSILHPQCSNVASFVILCAILQISVVAPHALAPAAAVGSFVAAVVAVIAYVSAGQQRTSTGVITAALARRTTPKARPRMRHCERAPPLSYTGLRFVERSKLQASHMPLGGAVHAPSSRCGVVVFGNYTRLQRSKSAAAAVPVASGMRCAMW